MPLTINTEAEQVDETPVLDTNTPTLGGELFSCDHTYKTLPTKAEMDVSLQNEIQIATTKIRNQGTQNGETEEVITQKIDARVKWLRRKHSEATNVTLEFSKKNCEFPPAEWNDKIPEYIANSPAYQILTKQFVEMQKNWLLEDVTQVSIALKQTESGNIDITVTDNGRGFSKRFIDPNQQDKPVSYNTFVTSPKEEDTVEKVKYKIISDRISNDGFGGAGRGLAGMYRALSADDGDLVISNVIQDGQVKGAAITFSSPLIAPEKTNILPNEKSDEVSLAIPKPKISTNDDASAPNSPSSTASSNEKFSPTPPSRPSSAPSVSSISARRIAMLRTPSASPTSDLSSPSGTRSPAPPSTPLRGSEIQKQRDTFARIKSAATSTFSPEIPQAKRSVSPVPGAVDDSKIETQQTILPQLKGSKR